MKFYPSLIALLLCSSTLAEDPKPLLHDHALPVLAQPDFETPLAAPFKVAVGMWTPAGGVLNVLDIPAQKHIPVLHHLVGLASATIEVEFYLEGPGTFIVGCDSDKHVGRVVINAAGISIAEDSVKPSHSLVKLPLKVTPNEWHILRVEWTGEQMAANLDGKELKAQHPFLATKKSRSWLAAGKKVQVRNLRISGEPALEK